MNTYEKLLDFMIAVLVMIMFPMLYVGKKTALLSYEAYTSETRAFVDDITTHQKITVERLDSFLSQLGSSDEGIIVSMAIDQLIYEPVDVKRPGEIYFYHEVTCEKEIYKELYEGKGSMLLPVGTYFEVKLTFPKDKKKMICYGGAVR